MSIIHKIKEKIECGHFDQACEMLLKEISKDYDNVEILSMLGLVYNSLGAPEKALPYYEQVAAIIEDDPNVYYNIGVTHKFAGKVQDSIASFKRAVQLDKTHANSFNQLGTLFFDQGELEEAEKCFLQVIEIKNDASGAHLNLGQVYNKQDKFEKAVKHIRASIAITPDQAFSYNNLSNVLLITGHHDECLEVCKKAIEIDEDYMMAHNNYLFNLHYPSEISVDHLYNAHAQWGKKVVVQEVNNHFDNAPIAARRLRVGYISADFRLHSVGFFMKPIIFGHNRNEVEPFIYYNDKKADWVTNAFLKELPLTWRDVNTLNNDQIVSLIKEDRLDILVDLSGHTSGNRLEIFTDKVVPIQLTYLGYPDTTGLKTIDYRLTDNFADPVGGADTLCVEELVRLPGSFLCYEPPLDIPDIDIQRCTARNTIVFGSFNNSSKLSKATIKTWASVLIENKAAKLLLKSKQFKDKTVADHIRAQFIQHGVDQKQLDFLGHTVSIQDHLELYNEIDIALDPFPYNGTTTTFEVLLMGCPLITMAGDRHSARVGVSILSNLGLNELITQNEEEYISLAAELAKDRKRLVSYKATIRQRLMESKLTDSASFVVNLEKSYRKMWKKWCRKKGDLVPVKINAGENLSLAVYPDPTKIEVFKGLCDISLNNYIVLFLRHIVTAGETIVDVGGGFGWRAFNLVKAVGDCGQITVYEPSSDQASYLKMSVKKNGLKNVAIIEAGLASGRGSSMIPVAFESSVFAEDQERNAELIISMPFDEEVSRHELTVVDYLYLSNAGGKQLDILKGSNLFLKEQSPLIIVENVKNQGTEYQNSIIASGHDHGYSCFRLIPGLQVLSPLIKGQSPDYLFLCKEDKKNYLINKGMLVDHSDAGNGEAFNKSAVDEYFQSKAFSRAFEQIWLLKKNANEVDVKYYKLLEYYILAVNNLSMDADKRVFCLFEAYSELKKLCEVQPTLPRLFSLARMAQDAGDKSYAIDILALLRNYLQSSEQLTINEPHLAISERYEDIDPGDKIAEWLFSSIVEASIQMKSTPENCGENIAHLISELEIIETFGFLSKEFQKLKMVLKVQLNDSQYVDFDWALWMDS